ncbi:branched-chain amino acid aminotransferase [Cytophagales bacterium WSM2-2]|nr:branched-chain amino acid aminotransferase [Cytophagales bacterium WSM2-2]
MYYNNKTVLFLDGKFVKAKDAFIDPFSQTLHYGYGVFEGLRSYQTVHGVKIFKAREHFERMKRSCELLGIPLQYSVNELIQFSYKVLEQNNLSNAYIRPLVLGNPNMMLTTPQRASVMITAWEWARYFGDRSVKVGVSSYERSNPNSHKVEAKVCGHFVNSILATTEAKERGFDEGLLLDMDGYVASGPAANFFYEKNGVLFTAPLGNILPGITRKTVFEICHELDIHVEEKYFKAEEVFGADTAFFCGTAAEITPIDSIDDHAFQKSWKKTMSYQVQEAYRNLVLDKSYSYVIV